MSPFRLVSLVVLAAALAAPALAQQQPDDVLRKLSDAPLRKFYEDPMKKYTNDPAQKYFADPMRKYFPNANPQNAARPPNIYPANPLVPGGQPHAPRTFNRLPATARTQPQTGGPPYDARFRNMDANNDGKVSREEYMRTQMQRAPVNPSVGDLRADSLRRRFDSRFGQADVNRDGRLSPDEYNGVTNPRF